MIITNIRNGPDGSWSIYQPKKNMQRIIKIRSYFHAVKPRTDTRRFNVNHNPAYKWCIYLLTVLFLTACSGGGGSSTGVTGGESTVGLSGSGSATQGIAVDPYIVGAVFQEIDADTGTVLQRQSSPSDESGLFTFPQPLTPGSLIELKISDKGLHGKAPYQGMLSRILSAGETGPVVISPLTTLLDPMNGLASLTGGVTDQDLKLLQASMAANAYQEISDIYYTGVNPVTDYSQFEIFSSMVNAIQNMLNPLEFESIAAAVSIDPGATAPLILEDFILAVLTQQQTIVAMVKDDLASTGNFSSIRVALAVQYARESMIANVKSFQNLRSSQSTINDGAALYSLNCAGCHQPLNTTDKPGRTAAQTQTAIDNNIGGMGYLSTLTPEEVQAIADVLPGAPAADPALPPDGAALYSTNCAGCHQPLANTTKPGRTAAQTQAAIDNNIGGMGYLNTLTPEEVQAISDVLPAAPAVDPALPPDGVALYASECAGCHQPLASTTKPGRTAAQTQAAIDNNVGGMGYLNTLTSEEVQAIADVLPAAPAVDPTLPPDGVALYASDCAGCHQPLDTTDKPGRTAAQIQAAIDNNIGNMGYLNTLTPEEVQAIADVLPAAPAGDPGPDYSDCTLCHGQPPAGTSYPDTAGAHTAHTALSAIGTNCAVCHLGAAHNGQVDLGFSAGSDAQTGPATDNMDGTCSSIICHGGQTTPDWWSGSIVVDNQCASCHAYRDIGDTVPDQYNDYFSGRHRKHVQGEGYSCTVCHNTDILLNGHFTNLETPEFELSPAATVGGGSTAVGSYSNNTCSSVVCHGPENWD